MFNSLFPKISNLIDMPKPKRCFFFSFIRFKRKKVKFFLFLSENMLSNMPRTTIGGEFEKIRMKGKG